MKYQSVGFVSENNVYDIIIDVIKLAANRGWMQFRLQGLTLGATLPLDSISKNSFSFILVDSQKYIILYYDIDIQQ